jgi:nitronate monooxygenase
MDTISHGRLTAAVCRAGGFGILGGGYGRRSWLEQELSVLREALAYNSAPFGVGFITWSLAKDKELLELALDARPRAVMLSFGDPRPFSPSIHDAGALLICQVQNEAMAEQALAAGADILVAQGSEAGGHGARRPLFDLLPTIVDLAAGRAPVIAAGGIADGRGFLAARALGAEGVLMGTRFYASVEAGGHDEAKRRICAATGSDTMRTSIFDISRNLEWPAPFTARCVVNDYLRRWHNHELDLLRDKENVVIEYFAAVAASNFDVAAVFAGECAGLIDEILPVDAIIHRIVSYVDKFTASYVKNGSEVSGTSASPKTEI